MTPEEARRLIAYHGWARERMLDAIAGLADEAYRRDLGTSFGSVHGTLVHLYGADEVWYERWTGGAPLGLPPVQRFADLAAVRAAWSRLDPLMRTFVESLDADGLSRHLTYRAFNGQQATVSYAEMLQHVVNHGSYHRGQVTTLLRQLGAPSAKGMDLIAFYREVPA